MSRRGRWPEGNRTSTGTTPLLRAAKTGDAKRVKLLLEHGANLLAAAGRGVNGILLAANVGTSESDRTGRRKTEAGAIETIRLLMAAGADIHAADSQGRTAAPGAALWGAPREIEKSVVVTRLDMREAEFDEPAVGECQETAGHGGALALGFGPKRFVIL